MWAKDDSSDPPKVIFTPEFQSGITRVIYDPNADASKRLICEMSYLHIADGETLEDVEASFGVD